MSTSNSLLSIPSNFGKVISLENKAGLFVDSRIRTLIDRIKLTAKDIKEQLRVLLNIDIDVSLVHYYKKYKAMIAAVLTSILVAAIKYLIFPAGVNSLYMLVLAALAVGVLIYLFTLWLVDFYTNLEGALTVLTIPAIVGAFYAVSLNLIINWNVSRLSVGSIFWGFVLFGVVFLYVFLMTANVLNVALFKSILLAKVGEKVVLLGWIYIIGILHLVMIDLLGTHRLLKIESLVLLLYLILLMVWFLFSVGYYFYRNFKDAFFIVYGGVMLPVSGAILIVLGVKVFKVFILLIMWAYIMWEVWEYTVERTTVGYLSGLLIGGLITSIWFLLF